MLLKKSSRRCARRRRSKARATSTSIAVDAVFCKNDPATKNFAKKKFLSSVINDARERNRPQTLLPFIKGRTFFDVNDTFDVNNDSDVNEVFDVVY